MECHVKPRAIHRENGSLDFVLMTEYSIWRTHDKHAHAYAVLEGPRGQAMGRILAMDVTNPRAGCLNCHAMRNLFDPTIFDELKLKLDGVSCGGCHGPSGDWIDLHNNPSDPQKWRLLSPEEKALKGFKDLRDPVNRAELCFSCHIGDANQGRVVTHAMYAAGHPPLPPIEVATFSRNIPQHWRDSKEVPLFQKPQDKAIKAKFDEYYHLESAGFQQTQLALLGSIVALRETMKLARDRANFKAADPAVMWPELLVRLDDQPIANDPEKLRQLARQRWPEIAMAHSDCYACHHDLKYPGFRQERGYGYRLAPSKLFRVPPGRPLVRTWPTALLQTGIDQAKDKGIASGLESGLGNLAAACGDQPFGEPLRVADAAQALMSWCEGTIMSLRKAPFTKESVRKLMIDLARLYEANQHSSKKDTPLLPDYESARQITSLLHVAYAEVRGKEPSDANIKKLLDDLANQVNLFPYSRRKERLEIMFQVVKKATKSEKSEGLEKAMKEFSHYLTGDIGNKKLLENLFDNRFLDLIQSRLTNETFMRELLQSDVSQKLQCYGSEELQLTLSRVADFEPRTFQERLKQLAVALEASK
jgi:hypothetical protein